MHTIIGFNGHSHMSNYSDLDTHWVESFKVQTDRVSKMFYSLLTRISLSSSLTQSGYLDVVVPPDILSSSDGTMSDEGSIPENGTVKLSCLATGVPKPTVQWRREGGRDIVLRPEGGARDNKQGEWAFSKVHIAHKKWNLRNYEAKARLDQWKRDWASVVWSYDGCSSSGAARRTGSRGCGCCVALIFRFNFLSVTQEIRFGFPAIPAQPHSGVCGKWQWCQMWIAYFTLHSACRSGVTGKA